MNGKRRERPESSLLDFSAFIPYNELMPKQKQPRRPWKSIVIQALALVVLAGVMGLGRNALSSRPLPLFQPVNPLLIDTVGVRRLDSLQTREAWEKHQGIFLDARRSELFREGHIPGAKSLPLDDFDKVYPLISFSKDSAYIIYCEGRDCEFSDLLALRLYGLGYRKLAVFPGGWEEWIKGNHPVEK
jgi:rhodanese-related sulfurtransferase